MVRQLLIIAAGGSVGAVLRYLVGGWIQNLPKGEVLPYGTLGVNLIGCFFIGLLGGWADYRELFSPQTRAFLLIGLLGSFTTFSTFGYETLALLRDQQVTAALGSIGLHLVGGLLAVWLGYMLSTTGI